MKRMKKKMRYAEKENGEKMTRRSKKQNVKHENRNKRMQQIKRKERAKVGMKKKEPEQMTKRGRQNDWKAAKKKQNRKAEIMKECEMKVRKKGLS